ncbi:MAG TPA: BadF/BadG/BcrA/BcrD ATPase family protein [Acidimicrobiales bacterium]|nr:BadF/BadG/BcrA/BcrD ATPase family protein [Acidimicrobiales bacterium]
MAFERQVTAPDDLVLPGYPSWRDRAGVVPALSTLSALSATVLASDATGGRAIRVLGIDIGATHSRARLVAGQEVVAEARARSASVAAEGAEAAVAAFDDLLARLPVDEWHPLDAACVGAAGTASDEVLDLFEARLGRFTSDGRVLIVGDGYLVLPAAGLADGVGVICGTGAVAVAALGERVVRSGGWGYLLGDDGSGFGLVRSAIRALLDRKDRARPLGPLGADLLEAVGVSRVEELMSQVYLDPRPGRWAAYAPAVLHSSDEAARRIVEEAAPALDRLIDAALDALGQPTGLPVVLAGGLTGDPGFRATVTSYLRQSRPTSQVSILEEPPVLGAVRLAQRASVGTVFGGARRLR